MKIGIVHKYSLGDDFKMPHFLSEFGVKTIEQRILSGMDVGYRNHKAYADYNNYVFIEDKEPWYGNKAPDWSVWQAALRALKDPNLDVDWIFFSVNDIIYVNFEKRLEDYLIGCPDNKFLCTGMYLSMFNWQITNVRGEQWGIEKLPAYTQMPMISGWSHFVRKCQESIDFIEMLDRDSRHITVPRFYEHASTGDEYLSVWFRGFPEFREYWHLFSTHDHIHIPANNPGISRWNKCHNLIEYKEGQALMVFCTCFVSSCETIQIIDDFNTKVIPNGI